MWPGMRVRCVKWGGGERERERERPWDSKSRLSARVRGGIGPGVAGGGRRARGGGGVVREKRLRRAAAPARGWGRTQQEGGREGGLQEAREGVGWWPKREGKRREKENEKEKRLSRDFFNAMIDFNWLKITFGDLKIPLKVLLAYFDMENSRKIPPCHFQISNAFIN